MRIISQNGIFDFPYESCILRIHKTEIEAIISLTPDFHYTFAYYSTPKKAEKAMQLLYEAYSGMPIIYDISESEYEEKKVEEILKTSNINIVSVPNEISKIECVNRMIFQFPKEEDL